MEVRIKRADFLAELMPMQGIVERRTTIPVLSHILLQANSDRLQLASTDLDVSLTSWCEAEVKGEGGIAVQARKFLEIIRSLVGDEVQLVLEDERRLSIVAGKSRFKINGLAPEDFPTLPTVGDDDKVELPFTKLKRMIGKIIFAVIVHQKADRAPVHAIDRRAILEHGMQGLQHQAVAAERHDDVGVAHRHIAISLSQLRVSLFGFGRFTGDESNLVPRIGHRFGCGR